MQIGAAGSKTGQRLRPDYARCIGLNLHIAPAGIPVRLRDFSTKWREGRVGDDGIDSRALAFFLRVVEIQAVRSTIVLFLRNGRNQFP